ncbi:hypothetical protein, partial [Shigella flexneri]
MTLTILASFFIVLFNLKYVDREIPVFSVTLPRDSPCDISSNAVGVRGCLFQPNCDWVHLVFTLPDTLWPVF